MTVREYINFYKKILRGESVERTIGKSVVTYRSDGVNYLSEDTVLRPIDVFRIFHEQTEDECLLINELACGILTDDIFDYSLRSAKDLLLLVKFTGSRLTYIYMTFDCVYREPKDTSVVFEQIDIDSGIMRCDYFYDSLDKYTGPHTGRLSDKSLQIINECKDGRKPFCSENTFFDISFEGMKDWDQLSKFLKGQPLSSRFVSPIFKHLKSKRLMRMRKKHFDIDPEWR